MPATCHGNVDYELRVLVKNGVIAYEHPNGSSASGEIQLQRKQTVRWTSTVGNLVILVKRPGDGVPREQRSPFDESMYSGSLEDGGGTACVQAKIKDQRDLLKEYSYCTVLVFNNGSCISQDPRIIIRDSAPD